MNIRGYLRWQFEGMLSSMTFWAVVLIVLGGVAALMGCPSPWPAGMIVLGFALGLIDGLRTWFRFSYSIYEMERQNIERELKRKSQ